MTFILSPEFLNNRGVTPIGKAIRAQDPIACLCSSPDNECYGNTCVTNVISENQVLQCMEKEIWKMHHTRTRSAAFLDVFFVKPLYF
ncbi:MAG: hypothetical protein CSA20_06740 [Deltaproteobacteria bacterium]|nr:MAG: hypothetical protein CSA20_06740 [Deltaproteobacteria bacterium]